MTPFPHPTLDLVIMFLRMTFGGKPNASEWGCISETVADLANKLLVCETWDPNTLHSPLQNKIPPRKTLDSAIPFAPAYSTSGVAEKLEAAIPLAIHAITRPLDEAEPIPRHNMISMSKLLANGSLTETKTFLGWLKKSNHTELDELIGRLNHAAFVIPLARHFL